MRLKNRKKGSFVGPVSCILLLTIVALGMVCPQVKGASAAEAQCQDRNSDGSLGALRPCAAGEMPVDTTDAGTQGFGFNISEAQQGITDGEGNGSEDFGFVVDKGIDDEYTFKGENTFVPEFKWAEFIQLTTDANNKNINMTVSDPTTTGGVFTSESIEFNVMTNNANGFGVFVYAANDAARNLSSADVNNTAVIAPIAGTTTQSGFAAKTWGYSVDAKKDGVTNYHPITVIDKAEAAFTQQTASTGTELKLTCGTKVDASLPADTYQTEVVVSAVAPFSASLISQ